ncbi:tetratricopeptide repeat protein [Fontivita pretiosa]|uniref:tetratricopeptide repeat protein n=1 Tax=Fontivita pretiosa TaxID=2989684 RepID=UPI003D169547
MIIATSSAGLLLHRRLAWLTPLVPVLLALLVFWPVVGFELLLWDDNVHIAENPLFNPPRLQNIGHYWTHRFYGLYIPVTYTIWTVLGVLAHHPATYHAASLAVHLACVAMVYRILRRLMDSGSAWPAALGACVFAVHPLQVESVAWVSAFRDLLATFFCLLAAWVFLDDAAQHSEQHLHRLKRSALLLMLMLLAVLSKPTALVLPLALMVLGWLRGSALRPAARELVPLFALAVACAAWTRLIQTSSYLHPAPLWARPLVAADAIAFYLLKLLWPARLGFDYGRTPQAILASGEAMFTWIIPVAAAATLALLARRSRALCAAALIFLIGLLPVLGLLSFDFQDKSTVADHYVYLSMLGVAIAVAAAVRRYPTLPMHALASAIVLLLCLRSWSQIWHWRDTRSLAEHGLAVNPSSWAAWDLLTAVAFDEHNPRLAERFARQALAARHDDYDALINLGRALVLQDQTAQALAPLQKAVELRPDGADGHASLAAAYGTLGQIEQALRHCQRALELNPNHPQAKLMLPLLQRAQRPATTTTTIPSPPG